MDALNPRLIEDTIHLIETYQRSGEGSAFRRRFDMAIARDVNATYKNRPLKLYFEVLASTNKAKFGESYKDIRRLVKHDNEGIIKETLLKVSPGDLSHLLNHAEKAKENVNTTNYPEKEINDINKIEADSKDRIQKRIAHAKRLDQTEYFAVIKKTPKEIEKEEEGLEVKTGPGSSPEQKKSYNPATEEEKSRLMAAINQPREEVPKNVLISPQGEPLFREKPSQPDVEPAKETTGPSLPQAPNLGFAKKIFKTGKVAQATGAETSTRLAAGKVAARSFGGLISKGVGSTVGSALVKTSTGFLAKLGFSAATGLATGGIGLAVGIAITVVTTFGDEAKKLGKLLFKITVAIACAFILLFVWNWGERMNSLLPPYSVGEAAGLPTTAPTATPSGTITPAPTGVAPVPGSVVPCPIPGGRITCGPSRPSNTRYSNCNAGHCAGDYGFPDWCAFPGSFYAIDVPGFVGQNVLIPSIIDPATRQAHSLDCRYVGQVGGSTASQIITQFSCSDTVNNSSVWIQFHHLQNTYNVPLNARKVTGDSGGNIAPDPDGFHHVHIQIGKNGGCGSDSSGCVPADQYLQCGR